jgi:acyl-coenzyme A thioesterase PaaI-like protein
METVSLGDDRWCFACGENNPHGLKLQFTLDEQNALHTSFTFRKEHQGYTDIVHGGFLGLILDEIMLNLAWRLGIKAVTAGLEMRFKKVVHVGETVDFTGWLGERKNRFLSARAEARDAGGEVVAAASARCIVLADTARTRST